jgi:hypothetical protein
MYALTVFTPIDPARHDHLSQYIDALPTPSPMARLPGTHFARWVIVPDFISDVSQPHRESLPGPYLLFSATFDGTLDRYLDDLCAQIADEAAEIWGCCIGAPQPAAGPALQAYLRHNQIDTGLFFAAYPGASAELVKAALQTREQTIAFAVESQGMSPADMRAAFLKAF